MFSSRWKMERDPGLVSGEESRLAWGELDHSGMDSLTMQEKGLFLGRIIQSAFQQHLTIFPPSHHPGFKGVSKSELS